MSSLSILQLSPDLVGSESSIGNSNVRASAGNTALECQSFPEQAFTIKIDWLRVIAPIQSRGELDDLMKWLMGFFVDEIVWHDCKVREGRMWENYGHSVCGITAYYNLPDEENGIQGELMLNFSARAISRIDQQVFFWVCERLYFDFNARATRLDLALDDYLKLIKYDELQRVAELHNVKRFRNIRPCPSWVSGRLVGWTFYFGSRQSSVMFRIYDKSAETKGEIDAIRLEGEYHNELAHDIFKNCAELFSQFHQFRDGSRLAAQRLVHYLFDESLGICFVHRRTDTSESLQRADRCAELPWWQHFKQAVLGHFKQLGHKVELARPKVKPTLQGTFNWLDTKCSNAFTASVEVRGLGKTLDAMLKDMKTISRSVKARIRVALMEIETGMVSESFTS